MNRVPVVVFAHRRPDHLRRTLDALESNTEASRTSVNVFCDGARDEAEKSVVAAVIEEARRPRGFLNVDIIARDCNAGLAASITGGVTQILSSHEAVIVLEDDIVTSPGFLTYMNDALDRFSDDERVVSVHGYSYPTALTEPFFLRGADCWGWGTWRRGWALFEPDGAKLHEELRSRALTGEFDFNDTYPFTRMLEDQIAGKNDSWAVRWYASAFLADRLTLYPGATLVRNIGTDGSGTHGGKTLRFEDRVADTAPDLSGLEVAESQQARKAFEDYFRGLKSPKREPPRTSRSLARAASLVKSRLGRAAK
jgi:hypothetical protein